MWGDFVEIWDSIEHKKIDMPPKMQAFLNDIVEVYKKHGLSLSHEDYHGAFCVECFDEDNVKWLFDAHKQYVG